METTSCILSGRTIPLAIRRHSRARRISLRLSPARDGVVMTLPRRAPVEKGMDFLHSKAGWVLAHVETDARVAFAEGVILPVLGTDCVIRRKQGRGVTELVYPESLPAPGISSPPAGKGLIDERRGELQVHSAPEFLTRRVRDFLKKTLRDACLARAHALAHAIGKTVRDVKIRDTRSRWGSCSRDGVLTFHWQLVFAPPPVLDYLIAHETAHLREMNHGPRFWQVVAQLCPDHAAARRWLKHNGHSLHRYGP